MLGSKISVTGIVAAIVVWFVLFVIIGIPLWIAFESSREGNAEVYVMNADGDEQHNVSNDPGAADLNPAWSPDAGRIAFTSDAEGSNDIYVMEADGSDRVNVTRDPANDRNAAWSPDGTLIAFASDRSGRLQLYATRDDGSRLTRLTDDPASHTTPDWQRRPRGKASGRSCRRGA